MASAMKGTQPQKTGSGASGSKVGSERGTESATYGPLKGSGGGVPAPTNGGKPYSSSSPSKARDSY